MAVLLCRGEEKTSPVPVELRNAPRVFIKNSPIRSPTRQGTKTTARSDSHYACAEPSREEFWRGTYKRRSIQLNHCGFHAAVHRPYKELGPVEMNNGRLILEGLGQSDSQEQVGDYKSLESLSPRNQLQPANLSSPYRVKLRSKTPSQFPTNLANLKQEIDVGNVRLESIRRGRGLFELMKKRSAQKQLEEDRQSRLREEEEMNEWDEAEVVSSASLTQDQRELIERELLLLQKEHEIPTVEVDESQLGEDQDELKESVVITSCGEDYGNAMFPHPTSSHGGSHESNSEERSTDFPWSNGQIEDGPTERVLCSSDGRSQSSQSKQYCSADMDNEIERWYRILCILVWVLEAMRLESPLYMPPFHKCWNRERLVPDGSRGKRIHDSNKASLNQWEKITREQKAVPRLRSNIRATILAFKPSSISRSQSRTSQATPTKSHMTMQEMKEEEEQPSNTGLAKAQTNAGSTDRKPSRMEEEKMKKQRKLTATQTKDLLTLLEEELNYTKKQSRSRINAIIKQAANEARLKNVERKKAWQLPPISLDVGAVETEFEESEERRRMIAHEQLTAMERDRSKALHQRFSSLKVSGNLWQDLSVMREGVQIETTSMARRKLLMNYKWFSELQSMLPDYVQYAPKCMKLMSVLEEIAQYMSEVGPKRMSRRKLIQVLATRKPWELRSPEVAVAVEFLTQRVIYIVAEDYAKWLDQHTLACQKTMGSRSGK